MQAREASRYTGDVLDCLEAKQYDLVEKHLDKIKKRFVKVFIFCLLFPNSILTPFFVQNEKGVCKHQEFVF